MTTPKTALSESEYLLSRGSEWNKWDLHIHSPLSALANEYPHKSDGSPDWDAYIAALEALPDIPVLGITDYFSIEGYRKVLDYKRAGRLPKIKLILPNIEFRIDKLIATSKGERRLNYHVIFSDQVTPDQIDNISCRSSNSHMKPTHSIWVRLFYSPTRQTECAAGKRKED